MPASPGQRGASSYIPDPRTATRVRAFPASPHAACLCSMHSFQSTYAPAPFGAAGPVYYSATAVSNVNYLHCTSNQQHYCKPDLAERR